VERPLRIVELDDSPPAAPLFTTRPAREQAGAEITLDVVEDAGGGFGGLDFEQRVLEFFDRHLKCGD
jgi:hypothetical protein